MCIVQIYKVKSCINFYFEIVQLGSQRLFYNFEWSRKNFPNNDTTFLLTIWTGMQALWNGINSREHHPIYDI